MCVTDLTVLPCTAHEQPRVNNLTLSLLFTLRLLILQGGMFPSSLERDLKLYIMGGKEDLY